MQLMKVATAQDVGHALLPHVVRVFGGNGAMLEGPTGRPSAVHGMTDREARDLAVPLWPLRSQEPIVLEGQPGVLALPLRSGWLVVQATPYTPFFGVEELSLLQELGSFTDLALQRAELLEKERQARVAVEQTNTELETLVYGVSHDLKSPLISLMGYLEYLQLDHAAALDEEARHYLNRMSASAVYMQQLIQDLLELSRIGRVQTDASDVRLGDLLDEVAAEVRQRHPDVTIDVAPLPVVRINPVRGRQLFTNLMENAARHGGRRDVRIRVTSLGESRGRFEISVADDGVGIPEPYRERVFGIFERLDTLEMEDLGTGMGLAICRKIVEQVGGDISIAPSEVGADVRVLLPAASVDDAFGGRPVEEVHR
jgi:signal transduction histidine kinase